MQQSVASAERMYSLIDATPEVRDLPEAIDPGSIRGDIEFEHVDSTTTRTSLSARFHLENPAGRNDRPGWANRRR